MIPNRITCVGSVYFEDRQEGSRGPTMVQSRWTRELKTDELPFQRRLSVGETWQPVPGVTDWLCGACGMLILENVEGVFTERIPTEEQRAEAMARVIELGILVEGRDVVPVCEILPQEDVRFSPMTPALYRVRCRKGTARYWIHALPR